MHTPDTILETAPADFDKVLQTPEPEPPAKSYAQQLTDRARAALKQAGIKGVTVATRRVTYSRELIFTIRDPRTDYDAVKRVADTFEKIDRCSVSGEILCGGNTYVDINLGPKVRDFAADLWAPVIRATAAILPPVGTNSGRTMEARMTVYRDRPGEWKIWVEGDSWFRIYIGEYLQNIYDASASFFTRYGAPQPVEMKEAA